MQPKKFKQIKTERLTLKPIKPTFKNAEMLSDLIQRNREHFKFLPLTAVKSIEEGYGFLKSAEEKWNGLESASYGIYLGKRLIGNCSMNRISWASERAEISYWLDREYSGNGYMTEAVCAMADAFFEMGLNRLLIRANVQNKASCAVARRLGFKKEGVARQEIHNKFMGVYEDIVYYAMLRSEWLA